MKKYFVKIDGQIAPLPYTYDELKSMNLFDFEGIRIRAVNENYWTPLENYKFPEIKRKEMSGNNNGSSNIEIDEFGQIRGVNTTSSSRTSRPTNRNHSRRSSNDGFEIFLRVLGTIIILGVGVAFALSGFGAPLVVGCTMAIREIWKKY